MPDQVTVVYDVSDMKVGDVRVLSVRVPVPPVEMPWSAPWNEDDPNDGREDPHA